MNFDRLRRTVMPNIFLVFLISLPTCIFLVRADNALAEDQSIVDLKRIVVFTSRLNAPQDRLAENIDVYTSEDIQEMPAEDLGEVLHYVPGVDVGVRGGLGQATNATIRGSEVRHVRVMVDDIPFNTQLSGQVNLTKIPVDNAKRIEIIKGPASSAWGSGLGGVINVLTGDVGDTTVPRGSLTSSFGEFETFKNILDLAGKIGATGYRLTGSHFLTDGQRSVSDVKETKFLGKLSRPITDETTVTGMFGYSGAKVRDGVLPNNRITSTPYYVRYGKVQMDIDKPGVDIQAAYKYNDQDIISDTYNAATGAGVSSTVSTDTYHGLGLNSQYLLREEDILAVGADFEWHKIKSDKYLTQGKSIAAQAPYALYTMKLEQWDVTPGLRFDNNNRFGDQFSPSLGVVYHLLDKNKTRLRAKISRAFNAPPLLWTYNEAPGAPFFVAANPDLKAERALVWEVGMDTQISRLNLDMNYYWADVKDAINIVFNSDLVAFQSVNLRKVRRQGTEAVLSYRLSDELSFYTSGAYNHAVNRTTGELVTGSGAARQSFRWGVDYKNAKGFGCHLYGYYDRWDADPDLESNDAKPIFDIKLTKEFKKFYKDLDTEIFLNIYNIANSKYWEDIFFPLPRRYFEGGVIVKF